jgi:pyridoxamine 5'-phosphate oxidase
VSEQWVPLDVADTDPNPFVQFQHWFDEAVGQMHERAAITLVTSTPDGRASARMVLLRYIGERSLGWYTNYESRKGRELAANPFAALLWYCEPLGRQIRIEGGVEKMTVEESDAYFASRPRGHQVGAHASAQSTTLPNRQSLEERVKELEQQFEAREIPRPSYWGGYRLTPTNFEYWQHRSDRLHDRVIYTRNADAWERVRYAP